MNIIKTLVGILSLSLSLSLMFSTSSQAEVYFVPGDCVLAKANLKLKNKTAEPQAFWIQIHGDSTEETRVELSANQEIILPAEKFLPISQAFSVRTWQDQALQLTWNCENNSTPLSTLTTPLVEHVLPYYSVTDFSVTDAQLKLINLAPFVNSFEIRFLNSKNQLVNLQKGQLTKYYETQTLQLTIPFSTTHFQIKADARLNSWVNFDLNKFSSGRSRKPAALPAMDNKKYFLVSTKNETNAESFVVASDNPAMILQAREQIQNPLLEKIVVAKIALGNGGYNRSFTGQEHSPYSWSVNEINAFADFAYIDCDGSPDLLEENLMTRINEGGRICFWRYRIIRELTLDEVRQGK